MRTAARRAQALVVAIVLFGNNTTAVGRENYSDRVGPCVGHLETREPPTNVSDLAGREIASGTEFVIPVSLTVLVVQCAGTSPWISDRRDVREPSDGLGI